MDKPLLPAAALTVCFYLPQYFDNLQYRPMVAGAKPFFGGLPGLVYGLLGVLLIWQKRYPQRITALPLRLYISMFASLALGYTNLANWLGLCNAANTAHVAGLQCGLACAQI